MTVKKQPAKRVRLTGANVDKLEPRDRAYLVYDKDLIGFCVRVSPAGTKSFAVEYRPHPGGRSTPMRRMTLGKLTEKYTATMAREEAKGILARVQLREDPARERIDERKALTVAGLIDAYQQGGLRVQRGKRRGQLMKPTTAAYTLARLKHHVVPLLGHIPAASITSRDIEKMCHSIEAGKTARDEVVDGRRVIVSGGPGAARKALRDTSALFTFACRNGYAPENPAKDVNYDKVDGTRERFLSTEEIQRLSATLDELEDEGKNVKGLNIVRLLMLTGCRRNEIAGLKWSEVDFKNRQLILEESKTGKSVRPLASAALELLSEIDAEEGSEFVFPAVTGDGHYQGLKGLWRVIVERADLPGITPHSLRHTLASVAVSGNMSLALTGALLGHANQRSTTRYAHLAPTSTQVAAEQAVGTIAAAMDGKPAAEPISLPDRKRS